MSQHGGLMGVAPLHALLVSREPTVIQRRAVNFEFMASASVLDIHIFYTCKCLPIIISFVRVIYLLLSL